MLGLSPSVSNASSSEQSALGVADFQTQQTMPYKLLAPRSTCPPKFAVALASSRSIAGVIAQLRDIVALALSARAFHV